MTANQLDAKLFTPLARPAEQRLSEFNPQELANTAWAFATVKQSDEKLFTALARAAEQRVSEFNAQELANTAWAFATVGRLDTTMVSVMSQEVFEWIRGYEATCQIGEGLSSDFAMDVISILWAFNFAGVLEPEFAEPVREVLRIVGREMDCSRLALHKMPRFREGSHSGPDEPYVELDVGDMMVIYKSPGWEVDTVHGGDSRWLSQYL